MATFYVTAFYRDAYTRKGTKRFQLEVVDHAAALTRAASLVGALANIMEAEIVKYTVWQEVAYSDTLDAGANKDEGATFSCDLGAGKEAALKIPSPLHSIRNADGSIDLLDAAVTGLESEFLSGEVLISDGEVVLDFLKGTLDK